MTLVLFLLLAVVFSAVWLSVFAIFWGACLWLDAHTTPLLDMEV